MFTILRIPIFIAVSVAICSSIVFAKSGAVTSRKTPTPAAKEESAYHTFLPGEHRRFKEDTLESCNKLIADAKNNPNLQEMAYARRGNFYGHLKKYPEAIADFTKAISLLKKPSGAETSVVDQEIARFRYSTMGGRLFDNRSEAYRLMGNQQAAYDDQTQFMHLKLMPDADRYMREGQDTQALSLLNEMIHLDASDSWAIATRGVLYSNQGNYKSALADFDKYVSLQPKSSAAFYYRGGAFFHLDQYQKAIDDLTVVVKLKPAVVATMPLKGVMKKGFKNKRSDGIRMGRMHRFKEPILADQKSTTKSALSVPVSSPRQQIAHEPGAAQEPSEQEEYAYGGHRHHGGRHHGHGGQWGEFADGGHGGVGQWGEFANGGHGGFGKHGPGGKHGPKGGFGGFREEKIRKNLRSQVVTMADVYSLRAMCYSKLDAQDSAIGDLTQGIALLSAKTATVQIGTANAAKVSGATEDVDELARMIIDRGKEYELTGKIQQAIDDLLHASKMSPAIARETDAYYELAQIYERQHKLPEAIKQYGQAIALDPDFGEAFFARGQAYAGLKQFAKAVPDYTVAIEILPENGRIYYSRYLALKAMNKIDLANRDLVSSKRFGFQE